MSPGPSPLRPKRRISFQAAPRAGGGPLVAQESDIFLAKFSPTGSHLWSRRYGDGGPQTQWGEGVATDGSGGIFVTGNFNGTVDFGGGVLVSTA